MADKIIRRKDVCWLFWFGFGLLVLGVEEVQEEGTIDDDEGDLLRNAINFPELKAEDRTVLSIDWRMGGLGSNICGPEPQEKYQLHLNEKASFTLVLTPYNRQLGEMMNFARVLPEK